MLRNHSSAIRWWVGNAEMEGDAGAIAIASTTPRHSLSAAHNRNLRILGSPTHALALAVQANCNSRKF
jgi:hypothetical protein